MDPTVSFVLAVLALVLSAGSFTVALLNFLRGRSPKPKWVTEVKTREMPDGERRVTATVTNRGRGAARDVTLVPNNLGLMEVIAKRKSDLMEFGATLEIRLTFGPDVEGDGSFTLSWSEEPNLHEPHSLTMDFHLDKVPSPDSRRGRRA